MSDGLVNPYTPGSREWYEAEIYGLGKPKDAAAQNADSAEFLASVAPVTGEAISARDAWDASGRGAAALGQGEYTRAGSEYLNMLLASLGAIPGLGVIARGTKRGAQWMDKNLPSAVNEAIDAISPSASEAKRTANIFAGPTAKTADKAANRYPRLAGEVEARNVQSRMNMTPAERRATPPWKTQDVPDQQQIIRFDKDGRQKLEADLPMDETSRQKRASELGYADETFYRGEASGHIPDQYASAYFSRDPEYAAGFAKRGGQDAPREFRLNLTNTLSDHGEMTAQKYGALVEAAAKTDPKLAIDLAESIAPGKGVDWLIGFSKARPDFVVVEPGAAGLVRHAIEMGSSDPVGLFRAAGYDALDSGRDVRKLTGDGIRLKEARFDPSKASSKDIMAGLAGASLLPAYLISSEEEGN